MHYTSAYRQSSFLRPVLVYWQYCISKIPFKLSWYIRSDRGSMVFCYHGQTRGNDSVQNDQPNQPTGPRIALFFYYHGRSTGEPTVRLVSSIRSDRIKEQALIVDVVSWYIKLTNMRQLGPLPARSISMQFSAVVSSYNNQHSISWLSQQLRRKSRWRDDEAASYTCV